MSVRTHALGDKPPLLSLSLSVQTFTSPSRSSAWAGDESARERLYLKASEMNVGITIIWELRKLQPLQTSKKQQKIQKCVLINVPHRNTFLSEIKHQRSHLFYRLFSSVESFPSTWQILPPEEIGFDWALTLMQTCKQTPKSRDFEGPYQEVGVMMEN